MLAVIGKGSGLLATLNGRVYGKVGEKKRNQVNNNPAIGCWLCCKTMNHVS